MGKKSKTTTSSAQRWEKGNKTVAPPREQRSLLADFWWLLPALILGFAVYVNTLGGEFVYDDLRQIVRNILIQDGSRFWQALTSDVWAFKGGDEAVSNYWRPSFVFWMILNFRCFGLNTFGWHLSNILLHLAVVTLGFALLRRLHVTRPVAGAIVLIFAVHPVHTESVAWISGAPDLILGAAMLGSIWFVNLLGEKTTATRWTLAIILFVIALGAKEVAFLYPLIVVALLYGKADRGERRSSWAKPLAIAWPFALVAIVYLVVRILVLGIIGRFQGGGATLGQTILTTPAVFAFYLRQMIAPFWIGPSYPIRALTTLGGGSFIVPLAITFTAGWWIIWTAGRSRIARLGLGLFLIPLLPAMNIAAFHPEQLVHDRYLYFPLFGFLILTIPVLDSLIQRVAGERKSQAPAVVFIVAMILAVPLGAQTVRYNQAWTSNLALWEWGVRSDPASAFNYQQYAAQLHLANRLEESIAAFNRSIEIHPMPTTYVSRATALIDKGHFPEAEHDLREVTSKEVKQVSAYTMYQAYERLAILFQQQRKFTEALSALTEARRRLPLYTAALTEKLAVILYQNGEKEKAFHELSAVQDQARTEPLPESRLVFYRLGLLNTELGHPHEARAVFEEFLSLTQNQITPEIKQARSQAQAALSKSDR